MNPQTPPLSTRRTTGARGLLPPGAASRWGGDYRLQLQRAEGQASERAVTAADGPKHVLVLVVGACGDHFAAGQHHLYLHEGIGEVAVWVRVCIVSYSGVGLCLYCDLFWSGIVFVL